MKARLSLPAVTAVLIIVAIVNSAWGAATSQTVPKSAPSATQNAVPSAVVTPLSSARAATPIELVPQKGHTDEISSTDWSADGRFILTGSADGTARLWDARSQILLRVFTLKKNELFQNKERVVHAVFILDGKRVALLDNEAIVHVFDLATGTLLLSIPTKYDSYSRSNATHVRALSVSRRLLVTHGQVGLRVVDLDTGTTQSPTTDDLRLLKHGAVLAESSASNKDHSVRIYDRNRDELVATHAVTPDVSDVTLSPDNRTVALRRRDSYAVATLELRDRDSFKVLGTMKDRVGNSANITFSPDGSKLVVPTNRSSVGIFDVATQQRNAELSTRDAWGLRKIARRPNSWKVAVASGDGKAYLFDTANAALEKTFDAHVQYITALAYSADGRYLATNELTNPEMTNTVSSVGVRLWDASTGAQLWKATGSHNLVRAARFSDDGNRVLLGDRSRLVVKDTKSLRTLSTIDFGNDPTSITFSRDATEVAIASESRADGFFNVLTGKRTAPFPTPRVTDASYLPDGKRVLFAKFPGGVELWDVAQSRIIRDYDGLRWTQDRDMTSAALSTDGRRFVALAKDDSLAVWDVETGAVLARLPLIGHQIVEATFLPNPDYVIAASHSGALRVWNIKNQKTLTLLADSGEWIVYTDDGYFDGSRGGGHLVAAVSGLSGYRIDQMAIRNNRPDIILERLGLGSSELISHYRALYERRLRKLGIREEELDGTFEKAPTVEVVESSQLRRSAVLELDASAAHYDLKSYNVYVNDVPLFGLAGKPLSGRHQRIRETVALSTGKNEIEVGVLGMRGVESLRPSVSFFVSEKVPSDLYVLAIGVARFENHDLDLKFAAKDATDITALLAKNGRNFAAVRTRVYTDDQVTAKSLDEAKEFLLSAKTDDTVVLFVAGHGMYDSSLHDYYFLTHQTDISRLAQTAVPFEQLESLLQGIAPLKKLFLLDTCYSGEQDQKFTAVSFAEAGARGLVSRGIRRKALDNASVPPTQHLYTQGDRFIDNDLFRRSGAIVFSSSRGTELSYETDQLENGLFTEYVLRALSTKEADLDKDGQISSDELRNYVARSVSAASNGLQNPVVDRDNIEVRFVLPLK